MAKEKTSLIFFALTHIYYLFQRRQHFALSFLFSSPYTTLSWLSYFLLATSSWLLSQFNSLVFLFLFFFFFLPFIKKRALTLKSIRSKNLGTPRTVLCKELGLLAILAGFLFFIGWTMMHVHPSYIYIYYIIIELANLNIVFIKIYIYLKDRV